MRRVMTRLREEGGANAVMVALLLVVLLGMLSLSVDGGLLYTKYRAVRNANDAAALAAALSCAKGDGQFAADAQADDLAQRNVSSAQRAADPVYTPSCTRDGGKVTVHYKSEQNLFFSQVVGVSSPKIVSTTSTAAWGLASGATRASPLMLSMDRLSDCNIPDGMTEADKDVATCTFWWDNSSANLGNSAWGLMNLTLWNVTPTENCNNAGQSSYRSWLEFGFPGSLVLNDPPPTYVCRDSGYFGGALDNDIRRVLGGTLAFPVSDPSEQLDRNGNVCPSPGCSSPDKYYIVGFAWLKLIDLCDGAGGGRWRCGSASSVPLCAGYPTPDSNSRCLVTRWEGYQTSGLSPGGGATFGNIIAVTLSG